MTIISLEKIKAVIQKTDCDVPASKFALMHTRGDVDAAVEMIQTAQKNAELRRQSEEPDNPEN